MNRGDVVMVDWLYSDRTGGKLRPAVVVQANFLNNTVDDIVLVPITKTACKIGVTEVLIDPAVETNSELRFISVASCNLFMTIDQKLIPRTIGFLSSNVMWQIDDCLKVALQLP